MFLHQAENVFAFHLLEAVRAFVNGWFVTVPAAVGVVALIAAGFTPWFSEFAWLMWGAAVVVGGGAGLAWLAILTRHYLKALAVETELLREKLRAAEGRLAERVKAFSERTGQVSAAVGATEQTFRSELKGLRAAVDGVSPGISRRQLSRPGHCSAYCRC